MHGKPTETHNVTIDYNWEAVKATQTWQRLRFWMSHFFLRFGRVLNVFTYMSLTSNLSRHYQLLWNKGSIDDWYKRPVSRNNIWYHSAGKTAAWSTSSCNVYRCNKIHIGVYFIECSPGCSETSSSLTWGLILSGPVSAGSCQRSLICRQKNQLTLQHN